jgi:tetratricopeptide (TPR) repeat protein
MRGRLLATVVLIGLTAGTLLGCGKIRTRIYFNEGNKLFKAQKYDEAIQEYLKILSYDPSNWTANYQIAMSYLAMYHPGSTHPKDVEYSDNSIKYFEKLLSMKPPDKETDEKIRNYYVALLISADKTEKVVGYFQDLLKGDPTNGLYIGRLAEIYAKKGDFENALKWYQRKAEVEPRNKEAWYTIGVVCWERSYRGGPLVSDTERQQVVATGMEAIDKALALDPEYFEALAYKKLLYLEESKVLSAQGKAIEAGDAYTKADEINTQIMELAKKRKAQAQAASPEGGL